MFKDYAYAKINLALEVLDEIEDGYHIVNNLMVPPPELTAFHALVKAPY